MFFHCNARKTVAVASMVMIEILFLKIVPARVFQKPNLNTFFIKFDKSTNVKNLARENLNVKVKSEFKRQVITEIGQVIGAISVSKT